jgi:phage/plasmid-associated DNA primase
MNPEAEALEKASKELRLNDWAYELLGNAKADIGINESLKHLPKSELWAARAIADKFKNYLTYDPSENQWYFWNGRIHRPCVKEVLVTQIVKKYFDATLLAIQIVEGQIDLYNENKAEDDPKRIKSAAKLKEYKWFRDSIAKSSGIAALVTSLKTEVNVSDDHYSNDRRWFVFENGVYDMEDVRKTRQFTRLEHDASRPVYREWLVTEQPGASHEHLDQFIQNSIEDESQGRFFQKIVATACMGITAETRSIVSLQGAPHSGKSMILRAMNRFTRENTFVREPARSAIVKSQQGVKPEHARHEMRDARIAAFTEIQDELDREFILKYSGMDKCSSEEKYKMNVSWYPQGIVFLISNHEANIDKTDEAIFDRLKPINFPYTFTQLPAYGNNHVVDTELENKIVSQGSGFLEWMKEGYLAALEQGWDCSESMDRIKYNESAESDEVTHYLADRLKNKVLIEDFEAPAYKCVTATELYIDYKAWHSYAGSGKPLMRKELVKKVQIKYSTTDSGAVKFIGLILEVDADHKFAQKFN